MYSELLETQDLTEMDKYRIRYCRLKENCKRRHVDYETFKDDFFYFWNIDPKLVPSVTKMRRTILMMLALEIISPHAIHTLKLLINELNFDEQAQKIIQSKIALLQLLHEVPDNE